jgi:hypothetical protein
MAGNHPQDLLGALSGVLSKGLTYVQLSEAVLDKVTDVNWEID